MTEDERYRQSTQYRLWSYTHSSLQSLRTQTNAHAAQRVQAAVTRARAQRAAISSADTSETDNNTRPASALPEGEVQCLTPEEEVRLLWYYCGRTLAMGDHLNLPTEVKVSGCHQSRIFARKFTNCV